MALTAYVKGDPSSKALGDCPFCHRALLTLEAKKIPYTKEFIDFDHKPDWLQEKSGGKVPVIDDDGHWVPDSDVIAKYLEEKVPEPSLASDVPPEVGAKLFPAFRGVLFSSAEEQPAKEQELREELKKIDHQLARKGPLFGGDHLNATDASVAPKLYHTVTALRHYKHWELPAEFAAVSKYLKHLAGMPEWQATDYGEAAIIRGWRKHLDEAAKK